MKREIKFRAWGDGMIHSHEDIVKYWSALELLTDLEDDYVIMQYTGLKDKNGVEIYEGDILQTVFEKPIQVYWNNEMSCFYPLVSLRPESVEVIGNIYQNEDLL